MSLMMNDDGFNLIQGPLIMFGGCTIKRGVFGCETSRFLSPRPGTRPRNSARVLKNQTVSLRAKLCLEKSTHGQTFVSVS